LTGFTVTLVIRSPSGVLIETAGVVSLSDQNTNPGEFTYAPAAGDFVFEDGQYVTCTLYQAHWKVVDGVGTVVFFPHDDAFEVAVYRA
jgi:hypothetical protein